MFFIPKLLLFIIYFSLKAQPDFPSTGLLPQLPATAGAESLGSKELGTWSHIAGRAQLLGPLLGALVVGIWKLELEAEQTLKLRCSSIEYGCPK